MFSFEITSLEGTFAIVAQLEGARFDSIEEIDAAIALVETGAGEIGYRKVEISMSAFDKHMTFRYDVSRGEVADTRARALEVVEYYIENKMGRTPAHAMPELYMWKGLLSAA